MKVNFAGRESVEIELQQGMSVASAVVGEDFGIVGKTSCRGNGRCGTCIVTIEEGIESLVLPQENELRVLRILKAAPNQRLACQAIKS